MISFFRLIKFAYQDVFRNFSLSVMTVSILVLMLLSINTLVALRAMTTEATHLIKDQIDVSIFISHTASDEQVSEITAVVEKIPAVQSLTFISSEEVLADFREHYQDKPAVIASLDELDGNPLGPTLIIKTTETSDYDVIINALQVPEYENIIESRTFDDTEGVINRIDVITNQVEKFSIALSVFFGIIAFFIIFNTIRISIYTQREEISIKKLVGATNWFVRGPYLMQALFFTIVSLILAGTLVYFALQAMDPYVATVFQKSSLLTNYFTSNIIMLTFVQFVAVLLLTTVSSLLAMRRHLRV